MRAPGCAITIGHPRAGRPDRPCSTPPPPGAGWRRWLAVLRLTSTVTVDDRVDVRVGGALQCHRHARRSSQHPAGRAPPCGLTPGRPRTATRSSSGGPLRDRHTAWSAELVANRASSSTKIWCPCPRISHSIGSFRMVGTLAAEGASRQLSATRRRRLLGINLDQGQLRRKERWSTMDKYMQPGRATSRHTSIRPAPSTGIR